MGAWAPYYDMIMKCLTLGREKKLRQMQVDLASVRPVTRCWRWGVAREP